MSFLTSALLLFLSLGCTLSFVPTSPIKQLNLPFVQNNINSPSFDIASAKTTNLANKFRLHVHDTELLFNTFEWCANLGAPAALVGGAVLATLSETREDMSPSKSDARWIRLAKKSCRFFLLTSFAMEIVSIFATTVTGTMLLSYSDRVANMASKSIVDYGSPLGFLRKNHEFEYLTARITFLQGLFNWLLAVALEVIIPKEGESKPARRMNQFISSSLVTLVLLMLSFYNGHMSFYENYAHMLFRYFVVASKRYFWNWPPRPMAFLLGPSMVISTFLGVKAFQTPAEIDD